MKLGIDACILTGIPTLHAEGFQEVADATGNVILSRAVGKYATGLILEGYASKGFHNKAKSSNWGPMAGFVLADPRFTKVGGTAQGVQEQKKALLHAVAEHAIGVPLFISENRRHWLCQNFLMNTITKNADSHLVRSSSPWGLRLDFKLLRERPMHARGDMWGVYYSRPERHGAEASSFSRVMAMRDPQCEIHPSDYRAATTGDYDLFAVWSKKQQYSPDAGDRRMVSNAILESNIRKNLADTGEDKHLGNITPRIRELRDRLNKAFKIRGYTGGNMVHHSDEGGRPFVKDIDLPVFAVVPGRLEPFALEDVADLRQFITAELNGDYAPVFSPGWMRELTHVGVGGISPEALTMQKSRLRKTQKHGLF
jgi:hypothetical protein